MHARTMTMALLSLLAAAPAVAQQTRQDPEQLREMVVRRFMENFRTQAALTDEQFGRLQESMRRTFQSRREMQHEEQEMLQALQAQLRPGVAADRDSVGRLLDAVIAVQQNRIDRLRAEQAELAEYLDPVQRGQLVLAFARLERQIQQLIQERVQGAQPPRRRE